MRVNMSKFLWSYLLISPAVLGATLVVSSSAMAADAQQAADALNPAVAKAETAETSEAKLNALAAVSETTAASKPVEEISQAAGSETPAAIADSTAAATESAIVGANTAPAEANPQAASQPTSESLAAVEPTVAQPVENSAPAAQLETPAPAATALPEQIGAVQLETPAPAVAESAEQNLPKPAESLAQTAAPQEQNPAATLEQLNQYSSEGAAGGETEGQVTSVSQLSDVRPTDWAFQALQSLVERYGCIAGYPDGTFRGNRAMTRYEFAAGLNACLDKVSELIQGGSRNLATREDLASVQRLQEEFAAELATLRGRVDALEARASELEANQFSTTTKLNGEVIFALTGIARGEDAEGRKADKTTAFGSRVRLNFDTSFSGKDLLRTRLQVLNLGSFSTNNTKTAEGELRFHAGPFAEASNTVGLDALLYQFPLGKSTTVILEANAGAADDFANTVNPYFDGDGGSGALSNFGTRNPIYYLTGGSGIGLRHQFGDKLELSLGYLAGNAANPTRGNGLFNGSYGGLAQLTFKPNDNMALGLTYVNSYNFVTGTGSNASNFPVRLGSFGFDSDNTLPVSSNSYGAQASWRLNRRLAIGGWAGYTNQRILSNLATPTGSVQRGDQKIWNWAVTLAFPDLLKEGNVAGIVVGMEPRVTSSTNRTLPEDKDTSLHVEGFYQFKLSDNISITPGLIWLTAPDHNKNNSDLLIGVVRTTFTF